MPEQTTLIIAGSLGAVGMVAANGPDAAKGLHPVKGDERNAVAQNWRKVQEHPGEPARRDSSDRQ